MKRTRTRTIDIVLSALIALLVCSALGPALARMQRSSAEAKCQSNLRRWAQAISAYMADNHQRYPTNRITAAHPMSGRVWLSDETLLDGNGNPLRFQYGVNWVEALYPYLEAAAGRTGQDWKSFRKCPNASAVQTSTNACMTYSLNYNLVEQPNGIVRDPSRLMMFREMDKLVGSVLRPSVQSFESAELPRNAFLTTKDSYLGVLDRSTDPNRHGSGSCICFTDGHVKYFTTDYYPSDVGGYSVSSWDPIDQRWYNIVNEADPPHNKTIAITP